MMTWIPRILMILAMIAMVGCFRPAAYNSISMDGDPILNVGTKNGWHSPRDHIHQRIEVFRITDLEDRVLWEHRLEEPIELRLWENREIPLPDSLCPREFHESLRNGKARFFGLYRYPTYGGEPVWKEMHIFTE